MVTLGCMKKSGELTCGLDPVLKQNRLVSPIYQRLFLHQAGLTLPASPFRLDLECHRPMHYKSGIIEVD